MGSHLSKKNAHSPPAISAPTRAWRSFWPKSTLEVKKQWQDQAYPCLQSIPYDLGKLVIQAADRTEQDTRPFWMRHGYGFCIAGFLGLGLWSTVLEYQGGPAHSSHLSPFILSFNIGFIFLLILIHRRVKRRMRVLIQSITTADRLPICLQCKYDLRHTDSPTCPECGAPATLETLKAHYGLPPSFPEDDKKEDASPNTPSGELSPARDDRQ